MKNIFYLLFASLMALLFSSCNNNHKKIACVGDSITYGDAIENRSRNSYPAQLQKLLGKDWKVKNFGVNGATLLNKGDRPYQQEDAYKDALKFEPDIVVIKLGTNDTKANNWRHKDEYKADYKQLIQQFKELASKPEIYICLPAPAFELKWDIDSGIISKDIVPLVKEVAVQNNVKLIDLYTPLKGKPELFADLVHPNAEGAAIIAKTVAESIR